ncbi:hypothetical protein PGT21_019545 [Puccinia graminis f. sp. tritici]|uniref:Glutaminyl-tRNA synthetase class Ib non-specific RNA-binding domain-containing protein n=1 Tax=Puccinia graminis f. sp. tritici TaxID=56615 RepID=A0A5B0MJD2_PUCGR|nr:hypothetical protein PGT21_019545 [Puccinia graminis f. sp. tritici]
MDKSTIEGLTKKLQDLGLLEKQALDTARNVPLATQYISFIESPTASTASTPIDKSKASLLLRWSTVVVSKLKDKSTERKQIGAQHILNGNLASPAQVDGTSNLLSSFFFSLFFCVRSNSYASRSYSRTRIFIRWRWNGR